MMRRTFSALNKNASDTKAYGVQFLRNRFYNKGTAFNTEERVKLGMVGRLPPAVETVDEQLERCEKQFRRLDLPINKYQFLRTLQDNNNVLYYRLISQNLEAMLPIIYTPTVGEACQKFGSLYMRDHGIYVSQNEAGGVKALLDNVRRSDVDVIVVTDGSRILGLGDLGTNGMGIPIGKCSLYVAGAGLDPRKVLPVMIDVGTNNKEFVEDPMYLGLRQARSSDDVFYGLMDEFMAAATALFPTAVIQFEDFSSNHCFKLLDRYRDTHRCFNDDIQGTGCVIAAGMVNAMRLTKVKPEDHRIVVLGAGSAAVGVVESIAMLLMKKYSMSRAEVVKRVYLVDTKGLVTDTRGDTLAEHKVALARSDIPAEDNAKYASLEAVVKAVKPTAIIGLAASGPQFTEEIVKFMASYCDRPIIFPLSNPTSKAEISSADAYGWTNGKAIVASGSPFPSSSVNGKTLKPSQGNNMYIFPGIGLGCCMSQTRIITDSVLTRSAEALADMVLDDDLEAGLYPPLTDIRKVSTVVAAAVIAQVQAENLGGADLPTTRPQLMRAAADRMWSPTYYTPEYYYDYVESKIAEEAKATAAATKAAVKLAAKPKAAKAAAPKKQFAAKSKKTAGKK
jgi:malate dehydrogenase (oxaloacetate-decarboxylating)